MVDNQATQRLAELMTRIAKLPSANLDPPQFFANYLQLTIAATGSCGGAVWIAGQPGTGPQCYCHVDLERCRINEAHQQKLVVEAVQQAVKDGQLLVVPAAGDSYGTRESVGGQDITNQCEYPLFFRPLRAGQQVAMVLHLIGEEGLPLQNLRAVAGLIDQIAESGETYLAHRRAAVLDDDRKALARLLKCTEGVHGSLDPEKVIYQVANLGRDAVGCSRLVVWVDPDVKRKLLAVSGVDKPDPRAVQIQTIEKLCRYSLRVNKPVLAARKQLVDMPEEEDLTGLLKAYFNISQLDQIYLQPLAYENRLLGVLAAEGFDEQVSVNVGGMMASVAGHAATALANALEMASVPLVRFKKTSDEPRRRRRWKIIASVMAGLLLLALLVPWPVRIESVCELKPEIKRGVESPLDKVQITQIVRDGGRVAEGEVVAVLNSDELQTKRDSLQAELDQEQAKLDLETRQTFRRISKLQIDKLTYEIKLVQQQIDQCQVRAPVAGVILTPELKTREGLTVSKGDMIMEIADPSRWQLVLDVPQEDIGWVQQGLREGKALDVDFYLASYPEYRLKAEVAQADAIGQMARLKDNGNVFEIRVIVNDGQLARIENSLISGSTGQAKITTLSRPLGYVLLRKVIRFFRVTMF